MLFGFGLLFSTSFNLGSDYGYACPATIQIKRSVCQANVIYCS